MATLPQPSTPAFLQTLHWIAKPHEFFERTAAALGTTFRVKIASAEGLIWTADPTLIQEILTQDENGRYTAPGDVNAMLAPLLGDRSMIMLSGAEHRRHRKLTMPAFHGERMRAYTEAILAATRQAFGRIPHGQVFTTREVMQEITMDVILTAVFGLQADDRSNDRFARIKPIVTNMLEMLASPLSVSVLFFPTLQQDLGTWSPWGRFLAQRRQLDALLFAEIAERRANPDPSRNDVLNMLLDTRDESGDTLTDEELRDELMTMLFAGHETTATALAWATYWIHRDRQVYTQLLDEIGTIDLKADPLTVFRLPYLTAVCNETLRIYPVAMLTFPRTPIEPLEFGGHPIVPGDLLMASIYLLHHNPAIYPDSKTFNPDRFLDRQYSPFEFMPFGAGSRRCLGMALAQFEMKLVLAALLQGWTLELANQIPVVPQRRGVTLGPKGGVLAKLTGARSVQVSQDAAAIMG
ncbi:MAG: cytochrome P450 [Coleofasciculaceae cyanobacterium RL_1_1]|nr:cytochrome P450 [Coleofasciculaceae cyanobacterium RL_1_1]